MQTGWCRLFAGRNFPSSLCAAVAGGRILVRHADLEIQFAGRTVEYKQVPLQLAKDGDNFCITGTIPVTLSILRHS